jgi:methionine-rich copper-binding protein CopC
MARTPRRNEDLNPENDEPLEDENTEENVEDISKRNEAYERGRKDEAARIEDIRQNKPTERYEPRRTRWGWILGIILVLLLLLLIGWYLWMISKATNMTTINQQNQTTKQENMMNTEQKTNNFDRSIPTNSDTIPAPPPSVLVQTTSTSVAPNSMMTINLNGKDYGTGSLSIGANGLVMQRTMDSNAPDGNYTVNYKTCGSDGNCLDGSFGFKIDHSAISGYDDERNKTTAEMTIANNKLYPDAMLVSTGTKITITNNTGNTYKLSGGMAGIKGTFTNLSGNISPNGTFSMTFGNPGYFPFILVSGGENINGKLVVQ